MKSILAGCAIMLMAGVAGADVVTGFSDITVDNSDPSNVSISTLTYGGTTYDAADLVFGQTSRYYNPGLRDELWVEGTPVQPGMPTVAGTSTPKPNDVGSHADTAEWIVGGTTWISSIDGIDYQETIFSSPVYLVFVFERGGNDTGLIYPILEDDSLGTGLSLTSGGAPYQATGVTVNGQEAFGYVYVADEPIQGVLIEASGHDALTVVSLPEPATLTLLGLAGLMMLARRRN